MAELLYPANVLVGLRDRVYGLGFRGDYLRFTSKDFARRRLEKEVRVVPTGSRGLSAMGPIMVVCRKGFLCQVQHQDVQTIVEEVPHRRQVVDHLTYEP